MAEKKEKWEKGKRKKWREGFFGWGSLKGKKNCRPQAVNYEEYVLSFKEIFLYGMQGIGVCALVSYTFYRNWLVFFLLFPLGMGYPLMQKKALKQKRMFQLNQEFKEGILILAANLSAGYSIENALVNSSQELDMLYGKEGMINKEFSGMNRQIQMNRTVEQVFFEFAQRSGLEDVRNFAQVFKAAKRSGGDLVGIINHTAGVIRDKNQVVEEIANMTAAKKLEQKVMNFIPFFLIFYIDQASPGFFAMMYQTGAGRILMTVCLGVYGIAFWLSKRILDIPV